MSWSWSWPQVLVWTGQFASDWRGWGKNPSGDRESHTVPNHFQRHDQRKLLKVYVGKKKESNFVFKSDRSNTSERSCSIFPKTLSEPFWVLLTLFLSRQACRDFLALAQAHSKRWQKALQAEREQRVRLEETLEQLAKQHNHLERAFRGAAQANASADNKGDTASGFLFPSWSVPAALPEIRGEPQWETRKMEFILPTMQRLSRQESENNTWHE